jgi:predicted nucleotide-binding protein
MENEITTDEIDNFDIYSEEIIEQFSNSMFALQMQDLQNSEQVLNKAKIAYNIMKDKIDGEELLVCNIFMGFIELSTRLLRSIFYTFDERFKKASEELIEAKKICKKVNTSFNSIETPNDIESEGYFWLFKFITIFFERIIDTSYGITEKTLESINGKYIDEILMFQIAAQELRKINELEINNSDAESNNIIIGMIAFLNRLAEIYEKKAERIEEKRKTIEYLKPIDKNVFIAHGHNIGALRELEKMLQKEFNINPIILIDELDRGNTIIENIEQYGSKCCFSFIIISHDDWVINDKKKSFQARPNVLFELGWFCGRYGRSKVRILKQKDTLIPSDLNGLITFDFNENINELFLKIKTDLITAGIL